MSPVTRDSFPDLTISKLHAATRSDKEDNVNVETKVGETKRKRNEREKVLTLMQAGAR